MPVPRRFDRQPPERDPTRINERIRVPEVRLIDENGQQVGIMRTQDALRQAQERDLDLVEVAPEAKPPVCRILDYSKYKYEQVQKQKAARKHQQQINIREIKFRPKIAQHDYDTKKGHVIRFLKGRDKVKVTIMFRGREMAHPGARRDDPQPPRRGSRRARGRRAAAPAGRPQHDDDARPGEDRHASRQARRAPRSPQPRRARSRRPAEKPAAAAKPAAEEPAAATAEEPAAAAAKPGEEPAAARREAGLHARQPG